MPIIKGAQGNLNGLVDFITALHEDDSVHKAVTKRRKLSHGDVDQTKYVKGCDAQAEQIVRQKGTVEFPITIRNIDLQLQSNLALSLDKCSKKQALVVKWHYANLTDAIFASMSVLTPAAGSVIVEHECVIAAEQFAEDATETFQTEAGLFVAIAYAAFTGLITVSNVTIQSSGLLHNYGPLEVHMDLTYNMDPAHRRRASILISTLSKKLDIKQPQTITHAIKQLRAIENTTTERNNDHDSLEKGSNKDSIQKENKSGIGSTISAAQRNDSNVDGTSTSTAGDSTPLYIRALQSMGTSVLASTTQQIENIIPSDSSVEEFYAYLQPEVSKTKLHNYTSSLVTATLTPFQTQNVEWMINREAHYVRKDGFVKINPQIYTEMPLLYAGKHETQLTGSYTNLVTDARSKDRKYISELIDQSYRGGILADEMGLGKTISVLTLVAKHRYSCHDLFHPKQADFPKLTVVKSTLIIAPGAIINQWKSEINTHAPQLKVFVYEGRRHNPDIKPSDFADYDIVLTHYEAFTSEIHYTKPPPKRPRRSGVTYKREFRVSPLVATLWFRCILDEAQMIEAPLTSVSSVAKQIPRWYSWAVTGTPMKRDYNDLYGLYDFLCLEKTINKSKDFNLLCSDPRYRTVFYNFAKATIRRNTKSKLEDQIHIPKQHRHVVRIPFTQIEQHYYDDLWKNCKFSLRLDWLDSINWTLPSDASEETIEQFNAIKRKMRAWLLALRQNCVHPSMITNTSMRLGASNNAGNKKFQSLDEVLMDMAKAAVERLDDNQHAFYKMQLKRAGMLELQEDHKTAIEVYRTFAPDVEKIIEANFKDMIEHLKLKKQKRKEDKSKEVSSTSNEDTDGQEDKEDKTLQQRLLKWRLLLHQYYFFMGGCWHMLGNEEQEDHFYSAASALRRQLLEQATSKVKMFTEEMENAASRVEMKNELKMGARQFDTNFIHNLEYDDEGDSDEESDEDDQQQKTEKESKLSGDARPDDFKEGTQRRADINTLMNVKYLGQQLDTQLEKIMYLRSKIIPILTKPLVDSDTRSIEATGNEYEESLTQQELCGIYLSAYQALLQDRKFLIKGTITPLSELVDGERDNGEYVSHQAKQIEANERAFRKQLMSPLLFKVECFKDVELSLRDLKSKVAGHGELQEVVDLLLVEQLHIRSKLPLQNKLVDHLDVDFKKLSQLYNGRIAYYRYLQMISDTLTEWQEAEPGLQIERLKIQSERLLEMISQNKSRTLYFKTLIEEQKKLDKEGDSSKPKDCLICQEPFEKGIITYCGHTSCLECGIRWFKSSKRCHTCNATVNTNEWYNVSHSKMEMHNKEDDNTENTSSTSSSIPTTVDVAAKENQLRLHMLIQEISKQKILGGQGAKLDNIIRHIKHIKMTTNGKCVVFSQWTKVLDMLSQGLTRNGMKCVTLNSGAARNKNTVMKFQNDPDISAILLHARSQSSGLTLVAAQTVFIVEPVLNESMEKQAINRIHRIGQTKETNVFWYIVQDTIEERIQKIHDMKREQNKNHVIEEKQQLSTLADGGGESVADDDLRRCFTSDESYALHL